MPKVHHVKRAQKDYKSFGIKKGDSYYWWKFNFGPKIKSKTAPKPSQLTRSEFLGTVAEIEEELTGCSDKDSLNDIIIKIRELAEEQEEKKGNMPDSLQQGPIGELLEGRQTSLNEWADSLEELSLDEESEDDYPLEMCHYEGE